MGRARTGSPPCRDPHTMEYSGGEGMRRVGVLLLLLLGCGAPATRGADDRPAQPIVSTCEVFGLGPVRGELPLNCATLQANFSLVQSIMNERQILASSQA